MRRELTVRCVASGSVRTESADGTTCELRELWLELDGTPAHVRIVETNERGECTRDTTVTFGKVTVRQRTGHAVTQAPAGNRLPLHWLLETAQTMEEGEQRTVALRVRSMDPSALVHASPAGAVPEGAGEALEEESDAAARGSMMSCPRLAAVVP